MELMRKNASNVELLTTNEMHESFLENGIKIVLLSSISCDGAIVFDQFMLVARDSILYLTFEGPFSAMKCRDFVHAAIASAKRS
jgi:hypothetical protein